MEMITELFNKVMDGDCHQCEHGTLFVTQTPDGEIARHFDCEIDGEENCPIVIHELTK